MEGILTIGDRRISGIQLARDITTRMTDYGFDIYEKNSNLGGTWFENKYPGWVILSSVSNIMTQSLG